MLHIDIHLLFSNLVIKLCSYIFYTNNKIVFITDIIYHIFLITLYKNKCNYKVKINIGSGLILTEANK